MNTKFLFVALVFLASGLWAGEGTTAFPLFLYPPDARGLALGLTGGTRANDAASSSANPAVLGTLGRGEILFSQSRWADTMKLQSLVAALPTLDYGAGSLRLSTMDMGTLNGYDQTGTPTGQVGAQDLLMEASWGHRAFSEWSWWGLGGGYERERLGNVVADATYVNAGGLVQLPPTRWITDQRVGASLQQWGPKTSGGTPLANEIRLAMSGQIQRLNLSFDLLWPREQTPHPHAGAEYAVGENAFFRLGYSGSLPSRNALSYGLGLRVGDLHVDYAFLPLGDLGDTHHLTFSIRFGRLTEKELERGAEALRGEDPANAIIHFGRVLAVEPNNHRAIQGLRTAEDLLKHQWTDDESR